MAHEANPNPCLSVSTCALGIRVQTSVLASSTIGPLQNDPADTCKSLCRKLASRAALAEDAKLTQMDKPIIWLIDENQNELTTYSKVLRKLMPESVEIQAILPFPNEQDYVSPVLTNPNTASIIIDQKLKDTGVANYVGIELAKFFRSINPKLPIYILTNFASEEEEFAGDEWSVEDIIDKSHLSKNEKLTNLKAKILRRINVYDDILEERERRFNDLLRKSLKEELTPQEQNEFSKLEFHRSSATLAGELQQLQELEKIVEKHKKLMEKLKQASESEDTDGE
jgi:DNA-binding NarL/FixJ family response regulator